jgi:hypothetical protein
MATGTWWGAAFNMYWIIPLLCAMLVTRQGQSAATHT